MVCEFDSVSSSPDPPPTSGNIQEKAVAIRAEIYKQEAGRESFFANLTVEIGALVHFTKTWDEDVELPGPAVSRVLDLLETRCSVSRRRDRIRNFSVVSFQKSKHSCPTYSNLEKLIEVAQVRDDYGDLNLKELFGMMRLKEKRKDRRDDMIKRLTDCREELEECIRRAVPLELDLDATKRRKVVDKVHKLLTKHWRSRSQSKYPDAHLLLNPLHRSEIGFDAQFDVWFCAAVDLSPDLKWQEADIFVYEGEWLPTEENMPKLLKRTEHSKGKTVRIVSALIPATPELSFQSGPWELGQLEGGVNTLIQEHAFSSARRLHLLVKDSKLQYFSPKEAIYESGGQHFISLHQLLVGQPYSVMSKETLLGRYVLAYLLATSFLQNCEGLWCPSWTKENIFFRCSRRSSKPNIVRPYLSTQFKRQEPKDMRSDGDLRIRNRVHPYPNILALGIILLPAGSPAWPMRKRHTMAIPHSISQNTKHDWFRDLTKHVHPLSQRPLYEQSQHFPNKILNRKGRVKVAILDTGIDLPRFATYTYGDRVVDYKDWIIPSDEKSPRVDLVGHGTHSAALLMKVAPEAELYVARVFKEEDSGKITTPSKITNINIAEAIRHAVDQWQVDIITMSFGFKESIPEIQTEIAHAYGKNVIMFASASNDGGNGGIAWPARLREVICIHASDGKGNKGSFTPNIRRNADNFSVLGTDVSSCWPPHLNKGPEVRKSGTSCATPIAAGIAAMILDLAGLYLTRLETISKDEEVHWQKLKSVAGMSLAFRKMAGDRDGYDYIQPCLFFGQGGYKVETAMDILLKELRSKL